MKKDTIFVHGFKKTLSRGLDHICLGLADTNTQSVLHGGFYGEPLFTLGEMPTLKIYLAHLAEHRSLDVLLNFCHKDRFSLFTFPNFSQIYFLD